VQEAMWDAEMEIEVAKYLSPEDGAKTDELGEIVSAKRMHYMGNKLRGTGLRNSVLGIATRMDIPEDADTNFEYWYTPTEKRKINVPRGHYAVGGEQGAPELAHEALHVIDPKMSNCRDLPTIPRSSAPTAA